MTDDAVILVLTMEDARFLSEVLDSYTDMGPPGEGWASEKLDRLRFLVDEGIEK